MKKYESIFILDQQKFEDGGKAFIENYQSIITQLGGRVDEVVDMGVKTLAYPIAKKPAAIYWDVVFQLAPGQIAELKEKYRLDESVLRYALFIFDRPAVVKAPSKMSAFSPAPAMATAPAAAPAAG